MLFCLYILNYIYLFVYHVCGCVSICVFTLANKPAGFGFLLPPCWTWRLNSGSQAWQNVPLSSKLAHARSLYFTLKLIHTY